MRAFAAVILLVIIIGIVFESAARLSALQVGLGVAVSYAYLNATFLALALVYVLGRTRYYRIAFGFGTAVCAIAAFAIALFGVHPHSLALLGYALIPVMLVSGFFPPRVTAISVGLLALAVVVIPVLVPDVSLPEVLAGPLAFVLMAGGVHLLIRYHKARFDELRSQELAEIGLRYRALSEHSNDGIAILDFDGRYVEVNRRLADILGYPADALIGRPMLETITSEGATDLQATLVTLLSGEAAPAYEGTLHATDGQTYAVELNATLVLGRDNKPTHVQVIVHDISQRQADHEALQRRHRGLMVLNRIITAATTTVDHARMLRVLCGELAYAFGLTHVYAARVNRQSGIALVVAEYAQAGARKLVGATTPLDTPVIAHVLVYRTLLYIDDPYSDPRMGVWVRSLPDDKDTTLLFVPLTVRDRVVSILTMELPGHNLLNAQDVELIQSSASAIAQAIETAELYQKQEQRAEELEEMVRRRTVELQEALKQAQAADRTKSLFVSNVSHELRTPLTSIRLFLDLANRGKPERIQTYVGALTRETARLQHLVESLLTVSRLDLGNVQLNKHEVDLNQIVTTLVADRQRLFGDHELRLSVETDPTLPLVTADPLLLEQVLTNLLTNAMNYTPEGGAVWLRTGWAKVDGTRWATVSVEDTGVGISQEERSRLFQRFERGQASVTLQVPGTGLGLAISKEIIDLHHGRITFESVVGEGSVFVVWLPLDDDGRETRPDTHPFERASRP